MNSSDLSSNGTARGKTFLDLLKLMDILLLVRSIVLFIIRSIYIYDYLCLNPFFLLALLVLLCFLKCETYDFMGCVGFPHHYSLSIWQIGSIQRMC